MKVMNMFQNYNISKAERVPKIKKMARQARPTTLSQAGGEV